eukprot:6481929-Amphidinium_carterae.3
MGTSPGHSVTGQRICRGANQLRSERVGASRHGELKVPPCTWRIDKHVLGHMKKALADVKLLHSGCGQLRRARGRENIIPSSCDWELLD